MDKAISCVCDCVCVSMCMSVLYKENGLRAMNTYGGGDIVLSIAGLAWVYTSIRLLRFTVSYCHWQ